MPSSLTSDVSSSCEEKSSSPTSSSNNHNEDDDDLWDSGQEWILIFDRLLKHPRGKASKGCRCDMCQIGKHFEDGGVDDALDSRGFVRTRSLRAKRSAASPRASRHRESEGESCVFGKTEREE